MHNDKKNTTREHLNKDQKRSRSKTNVYNSNTDHFIKPLKAEDLSIDWAKYVGIQDAFRNPIIKPLNFTVIPAIYKDQNNSALNIATLTSTRKEGNEIPDIKSDGKVIEKLQDNNTTINKIESNTPVPQTSKPPPTNDEKKPNVPETSTLSHDEILKEVRRLFYERHKGLTRFN